MRTFAPLLAAAIAVSAFLAPASAQTLRYPVHSIDFDIWCSEIERIDWRRCDKRLPEDLEKFEAYRHTVERYEIPYLKSKDNALRFDEDILRNDPISKKPDDTVQRPPGALAGGDQ